MVEHIVVHAWSDEDGRLRREEERREEVVGQSKRGSGKQVGGSRRHHDQIWLPGQLDMR
jgi:hypothetical protein